MVQVAMIDFRLEDFARSQVRAVLGSQMPQPPLQRSQLAVLVAAWLSRLQRLEEHLRFQLRLDGRAAELLSLAPCPR